MKIEKLPMRCDTTTDCDNRNSINVLEVIVARQGKTITELSKELEKARKELEKKNDYNELLKYLIDMVFSKKVFWLMLIVSFVINLFK